MSGGNQASGWQVQGATARGASHVRTGTPNQDAIGWIAPTSGLSRCALVLSDGHGGKGHDLSHVGSRLAVECALAELAPLIAEGTDADAALAAASDSLADRIHERWIRRIGEWHGARDEQALFRHGATLVAIAFGDGRLLAVQIGDGDILVGREDGTFERLFADDGLTGEQTHSLCQLDAPRFARVTLVELKGGRSPVDFAMASTDGLMKSFADDAGYGDLARHYRALVAAQGPGGIMNGLGDWLSAASASGSGDDISLGFVISNHLAGGGSGGLHAKNAPGPVPRRGTRSIVAVVASLLCGAALAAASLHGLGWLHPPVPAVEQPSEKPVEAPAGATPPAEGTTTAQPDAAPLDAKKPEGPPQTPAAKPDAVDKTP